MRRRNLEMYKSLEKCGIETGFDGRWEAQREMNSRSFHRDELIEFCRKLDIELVGDETVRDLRKLLHDEVGLGYENKSFDSELSVIDMRYLRAAVTRKQIVYIEDVPEISMGDEITINGEEYEVLRILIVDSIKQNVCSEVRCVEFSQNERLMIYKDYTGHKYSGVHFEKNHGDYLYPRWGFSDYVHSIET